MLNTLNPSRTSIAPTHPDHEARVDDWLLMEHAFEGERCVKSQGTRYLPATAGMIADGLGRGGSQNAADLAYAAYVTRAVFPGAVRDAVASLLGHLNFKPAIIELPPQLEAMRERATLRGETLDALLRDIHKHQLVTGRVPILLDVADGAPASSPPYACVYPATALINWRVGYTAAGEGLEVAVFDESGYYENADLQWTWQTRYRTLMLRDGLYQVAVNANPGLPSAEMFKEPHLGGKALEEIPLVVVSSTRLGPSPEAPPLLGLAHLCLAIYRGEADYRQALYATTQETLVRTGVSQRDADAMTRVGAGAILDVPMGGDAKYIGISGAGLAEQRAALEADRKRAAQMGAMLLDRQGADAESGEALRLRLGAATATLTSIAMTAAEGLRRVLQLAAIWRGADPTKVIVEPNLDFSDSAPPMSDLKALVDAKIGGAPLSWRTIHGWCRSHEITDEEFEDELDAIAEERTTLGIDGAADNDLDPAQEDDDNEEERGYPQ